MVKAKTADKLNFEAAVERLSEIVEELEQEHVGLDRSMELFAEGRKLADICHEQLATAEEKVKTLLKTGDSFKEEPGLLDGSGNTVA
ncbi:MAG: exodeoxyribonuclease VII small subunit [Candidatus Marinimicrobia bacterium]|nr:exodeoxyribonuclease VII small subunit [Candidatus Neomarinimicrobiota bacterium]